MTYSELVIAIQSYTENQFPTVYLADGSTESSTTQINRLIQQAEQRIYNTVQFPSLRKNMIGAMTTGLKYLSAPDDYLATYSMAVIENYGTSTEHLLNKDVNFMREAYPNPTSTGTPKYYGLFGPAVSGTTISNELTFILGPTPDTTYSAELHYYYYPESITTASAGTSWLGDNFDSVLLYGALLEAANFMKSDADTMNMYKARYDAAMMDLKQLGDAKERQDAYRSGQVRYPVK